jgi:hypothetical protein
VSKDVNVLALAKGQERYLFLFNDDSRADTLRTLGRYASNPELSFTWYDAAVLSQKIRTSDKPKTMPIILNRDELNPIHDPFANDHYPGD